MVTFNQPSSEAENMTVREASYQISEYLREMDSINNGEDTAEQYGHTAEHHDMDELDKVIAEIGKDIEENA